MVLGIIGIVIIFFLGVILVEIGRVVLQFLSKKVVWEIFILVVIGLVIWYSISHPEVLEWIKGIVKDKVEIEWIYNVLKEIYKMMI